MPIYDSFFSIQNPLTNELNTSQRTLKFKVQSEPSRHKHQLSQERLLKLVKGGRKFELWPTGDAVMNMAGGIFQFNRELPRIRFNASTATLGFRCGFQRVFLIPYNIWNKTLTHSLLPV
jgi:hypothetical protein